MEKEKALDPALAQIENQFGRGSVIRLGQTARQNVHVIPTGAPPLDIALGVAAIPRGRVTEIYGPEASGKTNRGRDTTQGDLDKVMEVLPGIVNRLRTMSPVYEKAASGR